MKVAVNGFGRIGRDVVRQIFEREEKDLELVAINFSTDIDTMAHLFKYDSLYGKFNGTVEATEDSFIINGKTVKIVNDRDPANLPWKELGVELVIDSTGAFKDEAGLGKHIQAGAKKVILTAPGKGIKTIVMGVNEDTYDPEKDNIISNASCTTNCLAPMAKVLDENFGIKRGLMTTIHAYTGDQNLHDNKHKDIRRARAAALSMVPTTTGAAKAVALVLPQLEGKLNGFAVRVPTPTVSLTDLTVELDKEATKEEINGAIKKAADNELKGILGYSDEKLVSIDFQGDPRSSIFDADLTTVIDGNFVKVVSWYDNEWGYSQRVVDLAKLVATK
ncbi:type I glyceraldehyde-3-phosphate dehydrogenase [Miniphocaeibacter halophilus]|uniref:Type I glyceraldehyde-3-phosphate dehydrogenase n=1 Tax=Miniphocaeibacter halophilus TaxID=2931922 RepID=A0AC61MPZ2_9FIRM|nr:type I glyceraldehyde-3-phosphate dehydrogenase [Miniphocaeibacter halophilus]QQK07656.1 type I glyceraldehyde-3-phosphate dehydrogenase [Miniphocaeibacter halophilus]